jgi:hypothetical protein
LIHFEGGTDVTYPTPHNFLAVDKPGFGRDRIIEGAFDAAQKMAEKATIDFLHELESRDVNGHLDRLLRWKP